MLEGFIGRISSGASSINISLHRALEQVLRAFNVAYNARRQRVLATKTSNQVVQEQLAFICSTDQPETNARAAPCNLTEPVRS